MRQCLRLADSQAGCRVFVFSCRTRAHACTLRKVTMSTPFFNLDSVRMDRFVRLDPTRGQLVAPLKKGMQSWQTLPLRKRKGTAKVKAYTLGTVTLERTADHVAFKVGSSTCWSIDPSHFTGNPKVALLVGPAQDRFKLTLSDAMFPGTEVPADFTALIYVAEGVWTLEMSFTWGGFQASAALADWLTTPLESPLQSTLLNAGEVCAFATDKRVVLGPQPSAVFLPCWGFLVAGSIRMEGLSEPLLCNAFAINLLTPEMPGLLKLASRRRTLLMLGNPWSKPWFSLPLEEGSTTGWQVHALTPCYSTLQMEFAQEVSTGKTARMLAAYSMHADPTWLAFEPGADLRNDLGAPFQLPIQRPVALQFFAHEVSTPQTAVLGTLGWTSGWVHTAAASIQLGKPGRTGFFLLHNGDKTCVGHPVPMQDGLFGLEFNLQATAARADADLLAQPTAALGRAIAVLHVGEEGTQPLVSEDADPLHIRLDGSAAAQIVFPGRWSSFVVRPADLLVLLFRFKNLRLHCHGSDAPRLLRAGNEPGRMVVYFPPQSLAEETPLEVHVGDYPAPIRVRLAGLSRLAFSTTESTLAFDRNTLLDWVQAPGKAAGVLWSTCLTTMPLNDDGITYAEDDETSIEAPYGLFVSGDASSRWHGQQTPALQNHRSELWHVNLRSAEQGNPVMKAFDYRREDPFGDRLPLSSTNRRDIVSNCIAHGFDAERFMLSPLGAWMNVEGKWEAALENWRNVTTMGRDHYVKTAYRGILLPFGHRAVFITISERKFLDKTGGAKEARLQMRKFILVREPVLAYALPPESDVVADKSVEYQQRQMPFKSVRLLTLKTADLDYPKNSPLSSSPLCPAETAFWPMVAASATPVDFQFLVRAEDRAGHTLEWMMPMAFVRAARMEIDDATPETMANYEAFLSAALGHSGGARLLRTSGDSTDPIFDAEPPNSRYVSPLHGQSLSLVPTTGNAKGAEGAQDSTVNVSTLAFRVAIGHRSDDAAYLHRRVNPVLADATLTIPVMRQLGQITEPNRATYAGAYLRDGFSTSNTGEIYLRFVQSVELSFSPSNGSDKVGGVVSPGMAMGGLSRLIGPVGVKTGDSGTEVSDAHLTTLANGSFDPVQYFAVAMNSKLLGGVTLQDILAPVSFSAAKLADANSPVPMWTSVASADGTCHQLAWHTSALKSNDNFLPGAGAELKLLVRAQVSGSGVAASRVSGELKHFSLVLAEVIAIEFDWFKFSVEPGGKPLVHVSVHGIEFLGALKFINALSGVLGLNNFNDPPYLDITSEGLLCGYNLRIPSIAVGVFALQNLALEASIALPFTGDPARARLAVSKRHDPFLITVSLFAGGGFFAIEAASDNTRIVEGCLEFGGNIALNLGVASGGIQVMAGIYFRIEKSACKLSGYVRASGALEVLGMITVSVEFYLALNYEPPRVWGEASVTVEVEVLFFSASVSLSVRREFAGGSRDLPFHEMISIPEWDNYLAAFAD